MTLAFRISKFDRGYPPLSLLSRFFGNWYVRMPIYDLLAQLSVPPDVLEELAKVFDDPSMEQILQVMSLDLFWLSLRNPLFGNSYVREKIMEIIEKAAVDDIRTHGEESEASANTIAVEVSCLFSNLTIFFYFWRCTFNY